MKRSLLVVALVALPLGIASALRADPPPEASSQPQASSSPAALRPRLEQLRARASASNSGPPGASASTVWPLASASGGGLSAELARKWADLAATRLERSHREQAALTRDLGRRLRDPRAQAELALHAKRVAELQRLEFLARNARSGAQRDKLLVRIAKLAEREARRHQKHLGAALPAASASASSVPSTEAPR